MRWAASWVLNWLGEFVWWSCDRMWANCLNLPWYPVYNWLMTTSSNVQGDGPGPWTRVERE